MDITFENGAAQGWVQSSPINFFIVGLAVCGGHFDYLIGNVSDGSPEAGLMGLRATPI